MKPHASNKPKEVFIRSLLFVLLLFAGVKGFPSEKIDFVTLDRETYRFYKEQKWDLLIDLGREGIKQGFDYYYLRYRMGVAYFSLENYSKASIHFEKAYDFNRTESSLLEYLYYANLYLNRSARAAFYADQLPAKRQAELISCNECLIQEAYLESGYVFSNDNEKNGSLRSLWTDSSTYLESRLAGNRAYATGGLRFRLSKRWSLHAAYSYLQADKKSDFMYDADLQLDSVVAEPGFENYYYSYQKESRSFTSTTKQNELYVRTDVLLGKDWILSPHFHYLRVKYQQTAVKYRPLEETAIGYYDVSQDQYNYFEYLRNDYTFSERDTLLNDYVAGLSVKRMFPNSAISLSAAYSQLNFGKHMNISATLNYFPFGNLNFYGSTSLAWFNTLDSPFREGDRLLFSQQLGFKLLSFLWIEGRFTGGKLQNTSWADGNVVYNVPDEITSIAGASLIFLLAPKLELTLRYQHWEKKGNVTHYYLENNQVPVYEQIETKYQNQMITGGLKWKL